MKSISLNSLLLLFIILGLNFQSCSEDDDETVQPTSQNQTSNPTLPSSVKGQVVNMKFTAPQTGAPYTLDQQVRFTFSSSGMLFLDTNPSANDGDEINISSFSIVGNEYVWKDAGAGFNYNLSLKSDSSINEVNVFKDSDNSFLGQFVPIDNSSNDISLVNRFEGSYTVTNVDKGTHSRMTVSIAGNGDIDFDTNVQLSNSDYSLISDKFTCCNAVYIDLNPYPTTPYPRVELLTDSSHQNLVGIKYNPQYPNVSGRVHVDLTKSTSSGGDQLTVTGDFAKVGGANYDPPTGMKCTNCNNDTYSWTKNEPNAPNRVLRIEVFSNGTALVEFSASSAFAASGNLASLGIVHDANAKTFTFTNVLMNEKFSQPGSITLNGKLSYN